MQAAAGPGVVLGPGEADVARHLRDFFHAASAEVVPVGVAYPRTTAEVSAILRVAHADGVPVVPQGGLTSTVGGAVPLGPSLVLSLERMRGVEEIDPDAATMTVLAGTVLEVVQQAADAAGFFFPLDLGGRGSAQVGGLVSTNAGGNRVLRYGMMRDAVLGLEAVLADGTVLTSLNKMLKNNTGYDLRQLFVGSEGTLGVVTRAVLRLHPRPLGRATGLLAVADYPRLLHLLAHCKRRLAGDLAAFEVMWPDFYALGTEVLGRRPPLAPGAGLYVLVETLGTDPPRDQALFEAVLADALEAGHAADATVAASERQRDELWAIRDATGEFPRTLGPQRSFDISLPVGRIGAFVDAVRAALRARWPAIRMAAWGHLADSNLHLALALPGEPLPARAWDEQVLGAVRDAGGAISAEHGIGHERLPFLGHSRSPAEIAVMRTLKHALDPRGILNPGKVVPAA